MAGVGRSRLLTCASIVLVAVLACIGFNVLVWRHATYHDGRAMAFAAKVELGMTDQELIAEVGIPRGRAYTAAQMRQIPGRKGIEFVAIPNKGSIVWYAPEPGSLIFVLVLLDQKATVVGVEIVPSRGRNSVVPEPVYKRRR